MWGGERVIEHKKSFEPKHEAVILVAEGGIEPPTFRL